MKKDVGQITFRLALCGLVLVIFGCQGSRRMSAPAPDSTARAVIEEDLILTAPEDTDEPLVKNGVTYEAPVKKIKNPQAEIILGRVKMDKTRIIYDLVTREMKISGFARVFNENKKEIGSSEFIIIGSHGPEEFKFLLKGETNTKSNSMEKPVVRAKITCLTINAKEEYECSSAAVDFLIAYKKQIYSEQMELVQKAKAPPTQKLPDTPPTTTMPGKNPSPGTTPILPSSSDHSVADNDEDDLQSEGKEDSMDGRYQGHAETADLKAVFEDDEAEDSILAPPAAGSGSSSQTPNNTTPSPPPTTVPPSSNNGSNSAGSTSSESSKSEKKEKQLTKDLLQMKNGDIRQINQSIGFPDQGNLRNATSLVTKQQALNANAFFEVVQPARNRHFATYEMAELITRLGKTLNEIYNHKLYVGNISQKNGGKLYSLKDGKIQYDDKGNPILAHASHQIGLDADFAYPTTDDSVKFPVVVRMKPRQFNPGSFSSEKTYELIKYSFRQTDIRIDRIFMDKTIKKSLCDYAKSKNEFNSADKDLVNRIFNSIDHVDGHGDHFHVRLKCSSYDPACRQKIYAVNKGCD